jgi:superkiller protein 3
VYGDILRLVIGLVAWVYAARRIEHVWGSLACAGVAFAFAMLALFIESVVHRPTTGLMATAFAMIVMQGVVQYYDSRFDRSVGLIAAMLLLAYLVSGSFITFNEATLAPIGACLVGLLLGLIAAWRAVAGERRRFERSAILTTMSVVITAMAYKRPSLDIRTLFATDVVASHYALIENDPDRALPLLQRAVKQNPQDATAWINLGFTLAQLGRKDESIDAYRTAIKLNSDMKQDIVEYLAATLASKAVAIYKDKGYEACLPLAKESQELDTKSCRVWALLAYEAVNSGKYTDAEVFIRYGAEREPDNPYIIMSQAHVCFSRKNWADAVNHYNRLRAFDPQWIKTAKPHLVEALNQLVNASFESDDLTAANRYAIESLSANSNQWYPWRVIGLVKLKEDHPDQATVSFAKAKLFADDGYTPKEQLMDDVLVMCALNEHTKAKALVEAAIVSAPDHPALHYALGKCLAGLHDSTNAKAAFERAAQTPMYARAAAEAIAELQGP